MKKEKYLPKTKYNPRQSDLKEAKVLQISLYQIQCMYCGKQVFYLIISQYTFRPTQVNQIKHYADSNLKTTTTIGKFEKQ